MGKLLIIFLYLKWMQYNLLNSILAGNFKIKILKIEYIEVANTVLQKTELHIQLHLPFSNSAFDSCTDNVVTKIYY